MRYAMLAYRAWAHEVIKGIKEEVDITRIIVPERNTDGVDFSDLGIPVSTINPYGGRTRNMKDYYARFKDVDCFFLLGWSWLIDRASVDSFRMMMMHPSPIPRYRGGTPIQAQILAGETTSAITVMEVGHKTDCGDIYPPQTPFSLEGDRLQQVLDNMTKACIETMLKILPKAEKMKPFEQSDEGVIDNLRRLPEDSEMFEWDFDTAKTAYNKIRCLEDPYPNAFLRLNGSNVKLTNAKLEDGSDGMDYRKVLVADAKQLRTPLSVVCKDKSLVMISGLKLG